MMTSEPQKWEVWLAKVKFEDTNDVKKRPVLVCDVQSSYIISLKMTGQKPRSNYYGEYALNDWQIAGLRKPTTVRCSKKLRLFSSDFIHKIGRCSAKDINNIKDIIYKKIQNKKLY